MSTPRRRLQQEPQSRHSGSPFVYKMRYLDTRGSFPAQKFPEPVHGAWQAVQFMLPHSGTRVTSQGPSWCGTVIRGLHAT